MNNYALEIENLVKTYGSVKAVNDISFKVLKGSLFAFLGINGAGKSTTINIICSILQKNSGRVIVNGYDLDTNAFEIKNEIGIVFQNSVLDQELTVKENLDIRTSFYSLPKEQKKKNIDAIIRLLDLEPILNRTVKTLSGGQKRRVDIARAMVHAPKLLILDEPTTGLDPKTRLVVWSLIDKIRYETNMTVFLTTHYLEEAEKATDVVIMDKGKIITRGTPVELKNKYSSDYIISYMPKNNDFEEKMNSLKLSYSYNDDILGYKIKIEDSSKAKDLLKQFDEYILDFEVLKGNMDDVFLNVTGKNIVIGEENEKK
ncbi:TPA: ABC transporter ATP-binding protein [Candidatus Avacholeplasma faecigallinarum]|nr:ABC transporter ATP-binding protein [Candidatus Avacholeplasma faecigallinarum]